MPRPKPTTPKKARVQLQPKPKAERPRCHQCERLLEPQFFIPPLPASLLDGRRVAQREQWEKDHPPTFTGHYGRYKDDRFCGQACGYLYAVAHTRPAK